MASYRYRAVGPDEKEVVGRLEATSEDDARRQLREQGLEILELSLHGGKPSQRERQGTLSSHESEQVTHQLAHLSASDFPLAPGLRAAACESSSRRVSAALESIAERLEQGEPLPDIATSPDSGLPSHVGRLIAAAARSGRLGAALAELVEHQRTAQQLKTTLMIGAAYPLLVVCLAASVLLFVLFYVSSPFQQMFEEFGLQLPLRTRMLFWWRSTGLTVVAGGTAAIIALALVVRRLSGEAGWLALVAHFPFFGTLLHWSGIAEWTSFLSVLIRHQIPLPEALRLAGGGTRNAHIGQLSQRLAEQVESGQAISAALSMNQQFPATLVPLARWGEESGMLSDSFAVAHEMFQKRVRLRSVLMYSTLPALLFIAIGCCVLFVVGGLFAPLLSLLQGLS